MRGYAPLFYTGQAKAAHGADRTLTDGSQSAEGIVVDGARDESGQWDFDADFTIFTADEELLVCHGYSCNVEIQ